MKNLWTFAIALLSLTPAFANPPTTIKKSLVWQDETTVALAEDSEAVTIWRFEGAVYNEAHPSLPYFSERYKMDTYGEVTAVFTNTQFEPFETKHILDDDALGGQIAIKTTIEKDRLDYFARIRFIPIRKTGGKYERLVSFEIRLTYTPLPQPIKLRGEHTYTSVLTDGDIYKFAVTNSGVHRLDFDFLKNKLSIPIENVDPRNIKLYGNGGGMLPNLVNAERYDDLVENAIEIIGETDGKFDAGDYIQFYAEGPDKQYFDPVKQTFARPKNHQDTRNYYFIKISPGNGLRIQNQTSAQGSSFTTTSFNDFIRYEEDRTNLLHEWSFGQGSGSQWFGDYFKVTTSKDYSEFFKTDNLVASAPAKFTAAFAGRIKGGSSGRFSITAGGQTFQSSNFSATSGGSTDTYASLQTVTGEFAPAGGQIQLKLDFIRGNDPFNEGWLDYIELNFRRQLLLTGNQMAFRDVQTIGYPVSTFKLGNANSSTTVWDITDPLQPKKQETVPAAANELVFSTATDVLKEFVAFNTGGTLPIPQAVGKIPNQNIHAATDVHLAIIYHKDFESQAKRLAAHREQHSNLSVVAVDVEKLYNEFSSGRKDVTAIRDFARMLFERSPDKFKSLLLFGDGSFDARDIYKLGGDYVPVYETAQSLSPIYAFPSDDYFALLSDGEGSSVNFGSLDIGVGRFPVKDVDEAEAVVDKVIRYDMNPTGLRDWRNRIALVGDDEDQNLHTRDADNIAVYIGNKNPNLNVDKIYLDAFPQVSTPGGTRIPLAADAINNNIFKGLLVMAYLGHGGSKGWTQERVLKIEDILSWQNTDHMPLIITATCSFSGFDNPAFTSAGELSFLNKRGGAIGLYTTVRPVFASANARLTQASMDTLFFKLNHELPTLGEALRISKNKTGDQSNSSKFLLIGDPSQQLALPNFSAVTTKVNGKDVSLGVVDTIRALQKVTIEGEILDDFGNLVTNFNGEVYPTIFDKKIKYRTLSQDAGSPPYDFDLQKNVIFKGRASVQAGKFKFTFVVPKDIDYNFGDCKISYYAADPVQHEDAAGNFQKIIVGGTDPNALADNKGPKVEVFMNDQNFVFGGITDTNPTLLVKLQDDNGINVVGNSIGHDLAGILDKNSQATYILNDFYEAALDDHTKGEVRYPLSNLAEGRHEFKVTAWDIANNPSEGYTEFVVTTSEEVALKHVLNYPNPFTDATCFMFEHNQSGLEMDVLVQIYTISGRLIKSLEGRIISNGFRLGSDNCIRWDGKDEYGDPLAKGVYLYKVKVQSTNTGDLTLKGESGFEKLVILK